MSTASQHLRYEVPAHEIDDLQGNNPDSRTAELKTQLTLLAARTGVAGHNAGREIEAILSATGPIFAAEKKCRSDALPVDEYARVYTASGYQTLRYGESLLSQCSPDIRAKLCPVAPDNLRRDLVQLKKEKATSNERNANQPAIVEQPKVKTRRDLGALLRHIPFTELVITSIAAAALYWVAHNQQQKFVPKNIKPISSTRSYIEDMSTDDVIKLLSDETLSSQEFVRLLSDLQQRIARSPDQEVDGLIALFTTLSSRPVEDHLHFYMTKGSGIIDLLVAAGLCDEADVLIGQCLTHYEAELSMLQDPNTGRRPFADIGKHLQRGKLPQIEIDYSNPTHHKYDVLSYQLTRLLDLRNQIQKSS